MRKEQRGATRSLDYPSVNEKNEKIEKKSEKVAGGCIVDHLGFALMRPFLWTFLHFENRLCLVTLHICTSIRGVFSGLS